MAIACLRLVTFLPLRPLFSLPFFISRISVSTSLVAPGEYLRVDFFLAGDLLKDLVGDDFLADVFLADDFVAICISSRVRWRGDFRRLSERCLHLSHRERPRTAFTAH